MKLILPKSYWWISEKYCGFWFLPPNIIIEPLYNTAEWPDLGSGIFPKPWTSDQVFVSF